MRAAILTFLVLALLDRAITAVFFLNFDVAGPNATAGLIVLLISAPLLLVRARTSLWAWLLAALVPFTFLGPNIAAWTAPLALAASVPLWRHLDVTPRAMATGVLLEVAARAVVDGAPLQETTVGRLALVAAVLMLLWRTTTGGTDAVTDANVMPWAYLAGAAWFASSPVAVAAWQSKEVLVVTLAIVAGLMVGMRIPWVPRRWAALVWTVAWADVLWWGVAPYLNVAAAHAAGVSLAVARVTPGRLVAMQAAAVAFLFMHVAAGNWAFIPIPEFLTRGHGATWLFALLVLVPLAHYRRDA